MSAWFRRFRAHECDPDMRNTPSEDGGEKTDAEIHHPLPVGCLPGVIYAPSLGKVGI